MTRRVHFEILADDPEMIVKVEAAGGKKLHGPE
jgi:hypothetical protein